MSPWTVSRVNLVVNGQRVDVWAEHPEEALWTCPHCTKTLPLYDHAEERTWRHLDSSIPDLLTYYQHPVTHAMRKGLNSQIQKIKSMACRFRNLENFKTAIYFHCGGLDYYPC